MELYPLNLNSCTGHSLKIKGKILLKFKSKDIEFEKEFLVNKHKQDIIGICFFEELVRRCMIFNVSHELEEKV